MIKENMKFAKGLALISLLSGFVYGQEAINDNKEVKFFTLESITADENCKLFYDSLNTMEQAEFNAAVQKVNQVLSPIVQDVESFVSIHKNLIDKYKNYNNLATLKFSVTGSVSDKQGNITRKELTADEFIKDSAIEKFYTTLSKEEQAEFNQIVADMLSICKAGCADIVTVLASYENLKKKFEEISKVDNKGLVLNVGFEFPLPCFECCYL